MVFSGCSAGTCALGVAGAAAVLGGAAFLGVGWMVSSMFHSIPVLPPTDKQLDEEDVERCPLFRHVAALKGKVAWREIGDFPTPIHRCTLSPPSAEGAGVSFYVKREDLSSPDYGGNKVRTLQHQLACCEAYAEQNPGIQFHVLGSGGSNQAVATTLHGAKRFRVSVNCLWAMRDAPDLDNTLNMLSALSFPGGHVPWSRPRKLVASLLGSLLGITKDKIFNGGGNSITGLLGQVSAALELAEQIRDGDVPDPEAIYLAVGSSCTITGLIVGICLARSLPGLRGSAFTNPDLKIVGVLIHHGTAALQRHLGFFKSRASCLLALTPMHGLSHLCRWLRSNGGPDLESAAKGFLDSHVEFVTDSNLVGIYGEHSVKSAWASSFYERHGAVYDTRPFAVILERAMREASLSKPSNKPLLLNIIMWQTKSAVQPRGPMDEWQRFTGFCEGSRSVRQWADNGKAHSALRPGEVSASAGPQGYRHLMTEVDLSLAD